MECTYFEYRNLTEKLFYGVPLTDNHMNAATEQILSYLLDGGSAQICKELGIGIRIVEKEALMLSKELLSKRFIWLSGSRKGEELTIHEIEGIGMFLKHGAFYNKTGIS